MSDDSKTEELVYAAFFSKWLLGDDKIKIEHLILAALSNKNELSRRANSMGIDYLSYLCYLLLKKSSSDIHRHVDSAEFALSDINRKDILDCLDMSPNGYSFSELILAIMETDIFKSIKK